MEIIRNLGANAEKNSFGKRNLTGHKVRMPSLENKLVHVACIILKLGGIWDIPVTQTNTHIHSISSNRIVSLSLCAEIRHPQDGPTLTVATCAERRRPQDGPTLTAATCAERRHPQDGPTLTVATCMC